MFIANIEWNDDLFGFIVELNNGKIVQVQFEKELNRLHADFGNFYAAIDKENEYGLNLTEQEEEEFKAILRKESKVLKAEKALNEPSLDYDADLKVATFTGRASFGEGSLCIEEEAHNINSMSEARAIWGLSEDDFPNPVGRPQLIESGKRIQVYLDADSTEKARALGDGNVSAGIREAIARIDMMKRFGVSHNTRRTRSCGFDDAQAICDAVNNKISEHGISDDEQAVKSLLDEKCKQEIQELYEITIHSYFVEIE